MEKFANFVVTKRKWIFIVTAVLVAVCAVLLFFVPVNYNSAKYLPADSETREGMEVMYGEYGDGGNASIMIKDLTYSEAVALKTKIEAVEGVGNVLWLDDLLVSFMPEIQKILNDEGIALSDDTVAECLLYAMYAVFDVKVVKDASDFSDEAQTNWAAVVGALTNSAGDLDFDMSMLGEMAGAIETFYKDGNVLFQISFINSDYDQNTISAIDEIRAMDFSSYMSGNAAVNYNSQKILSETTLLAMLVVGLVILVILFLTSGSLAEPILFLIAIAAAVVLNMGTNIILGEISFMSQGVAAILQLALTMDYSIFLLHRYKQEKQSGKTPEEAMKAAVKHSLSPISASSLTTIASFVALMFMSYTIGLDLGLVLAKGTLLSMITVFFLLPGLAVSGNKFIERTEHKTVTLKFSRLSKVLVKTRKILPIIFVLIIIPAAYLQTQNSFTYGNEATFGGTESIIATDKREIEATFGVQNQLAILIPSEYFASENALTTELSTLMFDADTKLVLSAQSYALVESSGMIDIMPTEFMSQFRTTEQNWSRVVVFMNAPDEGEMTDKAVAAIRTVIEKYVPSGSYYLMGESVSAMEIRDVVEVDYQVITVISIVLVFLVILFTFKSLLLPILLILVIQGSIFINFAMPYFYGDTIVFIGYMIVSAILLGATIDYAILFTSNYIEARQYNTKYAAMRISMERSSKAILVSAGIFTMAGFVIRFITSLPAMTVFGDSIMRGGIVAFISVMAILPQLLVVFDKWIMKTTKGGKHKFPTDIEVDERCVLRDAIEAINAGEAALAEQTQLEREKTSSIFSKQFRQERKSKKAKK